MVNDHYSLLSRSKEELVQLIQKLLVQLPETERLEFVSKWIDPEEALIEAKLTDSEAFLSQIASFCEECLSGAYSLEEVYEDYDDYEDDEDHYSCDFSQSEWALQFTEFLRAVVLYGRNGNHKVVYTALERLMHCLEEAEEDERLLGTPYPMEEIEVEWDEVFSAYYSAIKDQILVPEQAIHKALSVWLKFYRYGTYGIVDYFEDLALIEKAIRERIAHFSHNWPIQHLYYVQLKKFYGRQGKDFNSVDVAESLVVHHPNLLNEVAQGLIDAENWHAALGACEKALKKVSEDSVLMALFQKMVICHEHLNQTEAAYDIALRMYFHEQRHEHYLQARGLADALGKLHAFFEVTESHLKTSKNYDAKSNFLKILSYEGFHEKLASAVLSPKSTYDHNACKYAAKSLIYRALGHQSVDRRNLWDYLQRIEAARPEGVIDMLRSPKDQENQVLLLEQAISILKRIVQFHIQAATRSRYARAAYYCAIMKDLYGLMDNTEAFQHYFNRIYSENSRRPALKDEMRRAVTEGEGFEPQFR